MGREGVRETSLGPVTLETISEAEGRDIRSGDCVPLSVSYGSKCYDLADVWGGGSAYLWGDKLRGRLEGRGTEQWCVALHMKCTHVACMKFFFYYIVLLECWCGPAFLECPVALIEP